MDKKSYLRVSGQLKFKPRRRMLVYQLLKDVLLIAGVSGLLSLGTWTAFAASQLLLACFYFRGFSMMHDAVHGAVDNNARLNDWAGIFYGGVCFLPFTTWRSMHLEHHSWVGNFEKDPVMKMVRDFPGKTGRRQRLETMLWRSWTPYIAFLQELLFWKISARLIFERGRYKEKRAELTVSVAATVAMAALLAYLGNRLGSWLFFLPSILVYLGMVEIFNLPHHLSMPRLQGEDRLSLWEQYKVSRTCLYAPWFSHAVLLNFNYHAEHHMFPTLPWYELPNAYGLVRTEEVEGYQLCQGHEWIRLNRQKNLSEVFSPTEIISSGGKEKKAA